ncbi:PDZ and LIM domain protein 2-like [Polyodon spathula]|uniref:PDZ and LIM domain protein 2-like n=1 Tax=Polyodon spathula TaxID=7913 RepID=UPI001B7E1826|nr:PDZ and LIM domain protein 2-like [Polyodon spathula]
MSLNVNLIGPSPWGFRISGGRDFKKPIAVSKVSAGSKAEVADLRPGDVILEINGQGTADMLNVEAQNKIKTSKAQLLLTVDRSEPASPGQTNGILTPERLSSQFQGALQVSRDENQNYSKPSHRSPCSTEPLAPRHSPGYSKPDTPPSARSFQSRSWSPVEKSFSLKVSLDSPGPQEPVADVRRNSLPRIPTPPGWTPPRSPRERPLDSWETRAFPSSSSDAAMHKFDRDSEVYKMIQENKESRTAPRQSSTFRLLQEVLESDEQAATVRFPGAFSPSPQKAVGSVAGVTKFHICEKCDTSIVTQAVRIVEDRYRHPECYTCTHCGLNLKMRGHFWVGEEMFCEKHARERYQGPSGATPTTVHPKS